MKVYFIGAGPGDPGLLTVKARNIIKKADVIIYAGSLVNKSVIKHAAKGAKVYDSSGMTLDEVTGIIKNSAAADKDVARIHSGDPCVWSAIGEQVDFCKENKIGCEVIPGISSYQAASASIKQELTLPGVSQTVILTRVSGRTKTPQREALEKLAKTRSTMIIFLSVQEIDKVAAKLKKAYPPDTPVVVIEKASWPDERRVEGSLEDIAAMVKSAGIRRQAIIIVGDVLKRKYRKSRLYDKDVKHSYRSDN